MRQALARHRRFFFTVVLVAVAGGAAFALNQRAAATETFSCYRKTDCRCFFYTYCTDWPFGDPCQSSNDCEWPF